MNIIRDYYKDSKQFLSSISLLVLNKNAKIKQMEQNVIKGNIIYDDIYMLGNQNHDDIDLYITNCQNNMKYCRLYDEGRETLDSIVNRLGYDTLIKAGNHIIESQNDGQL